jgi:2-dehydro-3-deoxygluconokinase
LVNIVFAGNEEAKLAVDAGGGPMELAKRLTSLGPSQAVIKLGEHGCVGHIDGVNYVQESVPVEVVDTVGAGDGFVAGYLSEFLLGSPVSRRLQTAVTVGAFACMVPGDWEGMPFRSELGLLTATEPVSR